MKQYRNTNYLVSPDGTVVNKKTGKALKANKDVGGYLHVSIRIDGKTVVKKVHRLVAETYIPIPEELKDCATLQIDHINRVRTDNRVENLRWVSAQDNSRNRKDNSKILQVSKDGKILNEYRCIQEAADAVNGKRQTIQKALWGIDRHTSAYGYRWAFKNERNYIR